MFGTLGQTAGRIINLMNHVGALTGGVIDTTSQPWLYFLSALAQSLASIAALVVALTLLAPQVASAYGSLMAGRAFSRTNLAKLVLFLVSVSLSLAAIHAPTLRLLAVMSAVMSAVVLCWHFVGMGRSISPTAAIEDRGKIMLSLIETDKWNQLTSMADDLDSFARVALARQELQVYKSAIGTTIRVALHFFEFAEAHDTGPKGSRPAAAKRFTDDVFRRLRSRVLGLSENPAALLSTLEGVAQQLSFMRIVGFDELAMLTASLCETAARALPWPEQEQTIADIIDVLTTHILVGFGLSGVSREDEQRAVTTGLFLMEKASHVFPVAGLRTEGRTGVGLAWAALVRFQTQGLTGAIFHQESVRPRLVRAFGKETVNLLNAPPAGVRSDLLFDSHRQAALALISIAHWLPDEASLCPRLPTDRNVARLVANTTVWMVHAFAAEDKPRLLSAAMARIGPFDQNPALFELSLAQLIDVVVHPSFPKVVLYEQQGSALGTAVIRTLASARATADRLEGAKFLIELIDKAWETAPTETGFSLFQAADALRVFDREDAEHYHPEVAHAWFLAGGLWFSKIERNATPEPRAIDVASRLSGLEAELRGKHETVVSPLVGGTKYADAVGRFRRAMNIV